MFNQRKPKRFNYRRKIADSKKLESYEDLKSKWDEMRGSAKRKNSMPLLLIFLVFAFILIYVLNGYIK